MTSQANALFATFGIDLGSDIVAKNPGADRDVSGGFQGEVQDKTWDRYRMVFAYGYIAGGCTLFMVVLTVLARTTPLKRWPVVRLVIILLLALGIGLTATLFFNEMAIFTLLESPWVMPPITLAWTVALILTHVNGEGVKRHAHIFRLGRRRPPPYGRRVSLPLTPTADWPARDTKAAEAGVPPTPTRGAASPPAASRTSWRPPGATATAPRRAARPATASRGPGPSTTR